MKRLKPIHPRTERDHDGEQSLTEFRYGWIGPQDAMRHLSITSLSALYRLIEQHRLPYGRIGRRYRFRRADLDRWAEGQAALRNAS